ncbi:outer membrane protein assembly factor BamB family protein [Calycomorphotria hydatis]|uniref:Outer membrane biogenesis protein BamB n=1 Tax=Calycomorphotria hydatis TaxID=2528027 RepID=A0A517T903_9PLAN|nr:PQQ-binding-like beta-propeller repeat protein [Calycomorphotria hydatis]QDT64847.1 outer membrane biogenesis protein BamB [Calycomorphotria hydatis]
MKRLVSIFSILALCSGFLLVGCEPPANPPAETPEETPSDTPVTEPPSQPDEPGAESGSDLAKIDWPEEESKPPAKPETSDVKFPPAETPKELAKLDTKPEEPAKPETSKPEMKKPEPAKEESKPVAEKPEEGKEEVAERVVTGDWPMWGGDISRNMVNATTDVSLDIEPAEKAGEGKNLLWVSELGSQTYGNPVVANGCVLVGTNNGGGYRPQHPANEDRGVIICFNEGSGEFLWQLTREKLKQGRVNDWPEQGICSTPAVDGNRVFVVTNRCEVMCVDLEGFYDGENDGPITDEVDHETLDADIIWKLDMIEDLGVFPHNLATSSPVVLGDYVYVLTSNGVDEAHLEIPAPRSPSFICLNKETGELVWEDNTPFDKILHGQWSSPAIGMVNDEAQILMPGGDGWLYAFAAEADDEGFGKILWKFDLNPKDSKWELGGRGTRNNIVSTPVFIDNSVILSVGQDPEHGEGVGHIYRIDATKSGDISPTIPDEAGGWAENPNSGEIWHYGGVDEDGDLTGRKGELIYRRTISTVAVADGLVIAPDLSGFVHCLDFETGKRLWEYDMFAACWGSPMVVDGRVLIGDEDGDLTILPLAKELPNGDEALAEIPFNSSIYSTPTIANGCLFVSDRSRLYCFDITP